MKSSVVLSSFVFLLLASTALAADTLGDEVQLDGETSTTAAGDKNGTTTATTPGPVTACTVDEDCKLDFPVSLVKDGYCKESEDPKLPKFCNEKLNYLKLAVIALLPFFLLVVCCLCCVYRCLCRSSNEAN